ncbi:hypothetical protein ACQY0O_004842 [Thecaphora frezii]
MLTRSASRAAALSAPSPKSVRWGDAPTVPPAPSTPAPASSSSSALYPRSATATPPSFHAQHQSYHSAAIATPPRPNASLTPQRPNNPAALPHHSASAPATPTSASPPTMAQRPLPDASVAVPSTSVSASSLSLSRRIRWNGAALALLWLLPVVSSKPTEAYWAVLDAVYHTFGGSVDEKLDAVLGWITWAASLIFVFNLIEAWVMQRRGARPLVASSSSSSSSSSLLQTGAAASPMVQRNLGFLELHQAKGSPKTRPCSMGASSPLSSRTARPSSSSSPTKPTLTSHAIGTPTQDYSRFSPVQPRARAFGGRNASPFSSPGLAESGATAAASTAVGAGVGSSPLAAYRARQKTTTRLTRSASSGLARYEAEGGFGGEEEEEERGTMGDDSFEVERALRSLSYEAV